MPLPRICTRCGTARVGPCPCSGPRPRFRPGYTNRAIQRRKAAVEAHKAVHGNWCPGWGVAPHEVGPGNMLTADHTEPRAVTGDEFTPLSVLCRSCNSRKGART